MEPSPLLSADSPFPSQGPERQKQEEVKALPARSAKRAA